MYVEEDFFSTGLLKNNNKDSVAQAEFEPVLNQYIVVVFVLGHFFLIT